MSLSCYLSQRFGHTKSLQALNPNNVPLGLFAKNLQALNMLGRYHKSLGSRDTPKSVELQ